MTTKKTQNEDYYSILNCEKTATYEEIKQNYQQLIKKYHPDKNNEGSDSDFQQFLIVDKAWKTLRDEHLRKQYDNSLVEKDFDQGTVIHEHISKNELIFDDEGTYKHPCRCGSVIVIHRKYLELAEDDFTVECNECSNCMLVN